MASERADERLLCMGLMSGTSMDGIDAALVEVWGRPEEGTSGVRVVKTLETPYPEEVRERLLGLLRAEGGCGVLPLLCQLNVEIAGAFAAAAERLLEQWRAEGGDNLQRRVDVIGSHGQTAYHIPTADPSRGWASASTLQLGDGCRIAALVDGGTPTVSQLRMADMAAGGLGAPIMPFAELFMFAAPSAASSAAPLLFQNIGGMANATLLSLDGSSVLAFDSGPGNVLMDVLVQRNKAKLGLSVDYDSNGELASQGVVVEALLDKALSHPYFAAAIPKATGRELFAEPFLDGEWWGASGLVSDTTPLQDLLATAAELTAASIAVAYRELLLPRASCQPVQVVVSGGGASNGHLMRRLACRCAPLGLSVVTSTQLGVAPNAKEAVGMAVLAYCFVRGIPSNLPSVTGASRRVILGQLSDPLGKITKQTHRPSL